jgi:hypothetical protein
MQVRRVLVEPPMLATSTVRKAASITATMFGETNLAQGTFRAMPNRTTRPDFGRLQHQ